MPWFVGLLPAFVGITRAPVDTIPAIVGIAPALVGVILTFVGVIPMLIDLFSAFFGLVQHSLGALFESLTRPAVRSGCCEVGSQHSLYIAFYMSATMGERVLSMCIVW